MGITRAGLLRGARAAWGLAVVVAAFGVSFGVLATSSGFGTLPTIVMSITTFSGASQFAAVSILEAGGGVAAAVAAAVLLAARYGPIGLSVAPVIRARLPIRFLQSQLILDESWAIANQGGGRFDRDMLLGAGALLGMAWVSGTVVGALGGDIIGDPETLGLDAAFPALFLALLLSQLNGRRTVVAAILGGLIAAALIPFARPGIPIVMATFACLAGLRRG